MKNTMYSWFGCWLMAPKWEDGGPDLKNKEKIIKKDGKIIKAIGFSRDVKKENKIIKWIKLQYYKLLNVWVSYRYNKAENNVLGPEDIKIIHKPLRRMERATLRHIVDEKVSDKDISDFDITKFSIKRLLDYNFIIKEENIYKATEEGKEALRSYK